MLLTFIIFSPNSITLLNSFVNYIKTFFCFFNLSNLYRCFIYIYIYILQRNNLSVLTINSTLKIFLVEIEVWLRSHSCLLYLVTRLQWPPRILMGFFIGPISLLNPQTIEHLHKVRSIASLLETLQEGTKYFIFTSCSLKNERKTESGSFQRERPESSSSSREET